MEKKNLQQIVELIENTLDVKTLKEELSQYHNYELAKIISELSEEKQAEVFTLFNNEELAQILVYLDTDDTSDILEDIDAKQAASIINEMEPDDAVDILEEIDDEHASKIINYLDEEVKDDIKELSQYKEDSAGSIMNTNFIKVYDTYDVKDAMRVLVKEAPDVESISTLMVVDKYEKLVGILDLKKLIISKTPCLISDIMNTHYQVVDVDDNIEDVVKEISDYDILVMPVIDSGVIKGIITMDDAFDAIATNAEDDYAKLAGLVENEETKDSVGESIKKRIPWLIILLFLDLVVSAVIGGFGNIIAAVPILAFFQAGVLGLAGNCGTQALAIAVRKLGEDEEHTNKRIFKHLCKETLLGLLTGLVLGIASFVLVVGMLYLKKEVEIPPLKIGLVLGISILVAVAASNLFGALIPVIFFKLKIDPAVASGPFITTINDIIVVVIYFSIAAILLQGYIF
ncbi:MAG: magnesium transporter [Bacilli bacterium]|nr:magnesium transporter [Bacilli bacterium]